MYVLSPIPAERVASYVQGILVIESRQITGEFQLPLFANGTPTLLFSTSPARIKNNSHHLILFGQTVLPEQLVIQDNFKLVAYFLKPHALAALFNISACELTDQPIELDLLTGTSGLLGRLLNTASIPEILQLIDSYLFGKISAARDENKQLIYAAERIGNNPGKEILQTLQSELHLTERTFQRLFERHIGISPNLFRRVKQFNRAFRQVNETNFRDLSEVAYQNGYADQSHFIRTFKEFTHLTPSAYLSIRPAT